MASPSVDPALLGAINEARHTLGQEPLTAASGWGRLSKDFLSRKAKRQPRDWFTKEWVDSGIRLDEPDLDDRHGDIRLDAPRPDAGDEVLHVEPPTDDAPDKPFDVEEEIEAVNAANARITDDTSVASEGYDRTVFRGMKVDLPDEVLELIERGSLPYEEEDVGAHFKAGEAIMDALRGYDRTTGVATTGIGRHWSESRHVATGFADVAHVVNGKMPKYAMMIQAEIADEHVESLSTAEAQQAWGVYGGTQGEGVEREWTIKPGAKIKIPAIWMLTTGGEKINLLREPVVLGDETDRGIRLDEPDEDREVELNEPRPTDAEASPAVQEVRDFMEQAGVADWEKTEPWSDLNRDEVKEGKFPGLTYLPDSFVPGWALQRQDGEIRLDQDFFSFMGYDGRRNALYQALGQKAIHEVISADWPEGSDGTDTDLMRPFVERNWNGTFLTSPFDQEEASPAQIFGELYARLATGEVGDEAKKPGVRAAYEAVEKAAREIGLPLSDQEWRPQRRASVGPQLSDSGQAILDAAYAKDDPQAVGDEWNAEPLGDGASVPYMWTNTETGETFVVKDLGREGNVDFPDEALENEEAASTLFHTLGMKSAPVAKENGEISVTEWAGKDDDLIGLDTLEAWVNEGHLGGYGWDDLVAKMADPEDVLRVALADVAMGNHDRHPRNLMVGDGKDGSTHIYPIDHNYAQPINSHPSSYSTFLFAGANDLLLTQYLDSLRDKGIASNDDIRDHLTTVLTRLRDDAMQKADQNAPGVLGHMYRNLATVDIDRLVSNIMSAPMNSEQYWEEYLPDPYYEDEDEEE